MTIDRTSLRDAVAERLSERSFAHSLAVAQCAEQLAALYGVDAEKAWAAGLLHDWDRDLPREDLPALARELGIPVAAIDECAPHLLHAHTAAAQVAARFPDLDLDVILAIERHTVGHVDMSRLDIVVFVADMIEPGRSWPGVDRLRELAGQVELADLFFSAYEESLTHLVEARKLIHPDTASVWNSLVSGSCR